jgi:hypothetical protein
MEIKELPGEQHAVLLYRLSEMPAADERARQLEAELKAGLQRYQELLCDLENTIRSYLETAKKIKGL